MSTNQRSLTELVVAQFQALSLPKVEWTHHAHLRVGLWHLLRYTPEEAMDLLRDGIKQYNLATGVQNTESSGYHESITRFYVWQIGRFLQEVDSTQPIDELADALIQQHGDVALPLSFYSRDRLMSKEARLEWVEPDLKPLA